jgi:transposase
MPKPCSLELRERVVNAVESGASRRAAADKLRYLPKYSPELNPIGHAFSKLKTHLQKAAEPTIPRLSRRGACSPSARTNAPITSGMQGTHPRQRNLV